MTPITLTLTLHHNNRTIQGLRHIEDRLVLDYGFAIVPGVVPGKDYIEASLEVDLGLFDSEGDAHLVDLLNILPGDLIGWYVEEEG